MAFDHVAAAQNLKRRFESQRQQRLALHARAVKECDAIAQMIKTDFNPYRIYQWGSLLHPEQFDENSDTDMAVEGLDSASVWFALTGKALAMANPYRWISLSWNTWAHRTASRSSAKEGWCMSDRGRLDELIGDLRSIQRDMRQRI
jgi:hypothetical protein